jgi:hypothetical protein
VHSKRPQLSQHQDTAQTSQQQYAQLVGNEVGKDRVEAFEPQNPDGFIGFGGTNCLFI